MKYILSTFIVLSLGSVYAQSKKELRAQLAAQQTTIDSLQQQLQQQQRASDSLTQDFLKMQRSYNRELEINQGLATEYNTLQKRVWTLEEENRKLKEAQQPAKSSTKEKSTANNQSNKTSNTSPFSPGLSGNSGGKGDNPFGDKTGNTPGIGEDNGRHLIQKPNASAIVSEEDCTIALIVVVDENGEIVGYPTWDRSRSTTENVTLIKQVATLVKSEAKYDKRPGSKNVKVSLTIHLRTK